jgi:predicted metal-dependent HD superfamily phosphohydrolase
VKLSKDDTDKVIHYIEATKSHLSIKTDDINLKYFLDFDLSILASGRDDYKNYHKNVRKEYSKLNDEEWKEGRKKFLKSMLSHESIYYTDDYKNLDSVAKKNMNDELNLLK